jgi:thiamine kinase-like enzyme
MLSDDLRAVAARHVPGEGEPDIHRLKGGLVNETYRVMRDGHAYVLRVAGSNPYDLGLDREWEARVLEHAVLDDLAPAVEYCDPARGILIARWVDGRSWSPTDVRQQSNISRMAALARRIHALPVPTPARVMNPGQWIEYYSAAAPGTAAALQSAAGLRLNALAALPGVDPVLCHSDLHTLNLIDRGQSLTLLDWEYAHASDPLWDLAGWSANNDLESEIQLDLLTNYAGRAPTGEESRRMRLLGWLYDYVCLLWSELYLSLPRGTDRYGAMPGVTTPLGAMPGDSAPAATTDGVSARARWLEARLKASM